MAATSIEEAVIAAINLERASQVQLLASASGLPFYWTPDEQIAGKRANIFTTRHLRSIWEYYCRHIGPL